MGLQELFGLDGRVVMVVGASSGIGAECARAFATAGASVALVARRRQRLEQEAARLQELGATTAIVEADVTDDAAVAAAVAQVENELGPIYCLLNSAGMARLGRAERQTRERWDQVMAVNIDAAFILSQQVARRMIERGDGGRIIHISSVLGRGASPVHNQIGYTASKGAMDNMVRQLAVEWARHNITVNALAPGFFPTELTIDPEVGGVSQEMVDRISTFTPMARLGELQELQSATLFLAAPSSSYVTGVILPVDGGWTAW